MKKFFSLILVALLLVSAIPFQAFADEMYNFYIELFVDGQPVDSQPVSVPAGTNMDEAAIKLYAQQYLYGTYFGSNYSYVGVTDAKIADAENLGARIYFVTRPVEPACDHPAAKLTLQSNTATCGAAGVKTYKCECGETVTQEAAATGNHSFNAAGVCTCGATDGKSRTEVNFIIENVGGVSKIYKQTFIHGSVLAVPSAELISNYEFKGWYPARNGSGNPIVSGNTWDENTMPNTYYAWYVYNPNKDGMSTITVTARCYIDKIGNSYLDVPVLTQALPDNTNVFEWLQNNKNTTILSSVYNKVDTTKYEWKNRYFYNHNGNEVLTEQTVFANGPKAILIKLEEKDNTTRANVQLYLHTATNAANPFRILDMNGYTSGMNVTRDAAANLIKQYYSYNNIGNLYTESDWNALQNGENVAGRTSVYIADNGTYKIHVVVNNAYSKSSSNADPRNPKTGDYITIAVGTMVMAAAAFITLAEMKKRKMI